MAVVQVQCPDCHSTDVVQYGKQANGTQRYRCDNRACPRTIFLLQYRDKGRLPAVKQQIIDMTLNGSGVRDIVRVLGVSSATVINVLKKKEPAIKQVNERLLHTRDPLHVDIIFRQVEQAEMDEMWSFVGSKSQQRWLWHAIDHYTGQILAYVFGPREDGTFLKLQELLAPFGITHFYTDGWGAYRRHLDPSTHTVGKQHTQKIERKRLTFRTRIKRLTRKTICFSRSILMHDLVIGLFINRYAFGYAV
jgi:IS1 family transposase/transposase-like protein